MKITRRTIHGTLLYIFNRGVLIIGESGTGKSRIARDILGHMDFFGQCGLVRSGRLVADDIIELEMTSEGLVGAAPHTLFGLLEISGVGIIDVRRVFGPSLVRRSSSIDIIVRLEESPDVLTAAPKMTVSINSHGEEDIPVIYIAAGVSGDAVAAAVIEHIMIEAGVEAPVLDELVKQR
ncbi:MAG: hypothetical protein JW885_06390 [Deltaproteobacteria bacterium]|nr:hypothetical protein [Candidatus Zymogenaceae bacterium]